MASFLDSVPVSAIIKIRDLMHTVKDPFRLDQGDVSFDAPDTVKQAMAKAITENKTHYLPTTGVPRLRQVWGGSPSLQHRRERAQVAAGEDRPARPDRAAAGDPDAGRPVAIGLDADHRSATDDPSAVPVDDADQRVRQRLAAANRGGPAEVARVARTRRVGQQLPNGDPVSARALHREVRQVTL